MKLYGEWCRKRNRLVWSCVQLGASHSICRVKEYPKRSHPHY